MTWFKVDDSFYDHPKVFDAPDCALALWVRAGTWSARNLTNGFVPAGMPARLCDDPDTAVADLLRRGLWLRAKGGGYQFHDWADYQPTAAQVLELREKRAEAGRKGGLAKADKQTSSKSQASASGGAKQNAAPTRPDPSPSSGSSRESNSRSVGGAGGQPRERGSRLPDHFSVTDDMKRWAADNAPTCGTTDHESFCDYWRSVPGQKGRKVDWKATWRNWMRKEHERRAAQQRSNGNKQSTGDRLVSATLSRAAELEERLANQPLEIAP